MVADQTSRADRVDRLTFDELYQRDFRALVALAYGLSGSRAAAEELAQEAFLAAHRRWDRIGGYDDPSAWLRRVVVNRSVSAVRRRMAERRALARLGGRRVLPEVLPEPHLHKARRALAVALGHDIPDSADTHDSDATDATDDEEEAR